MATAPRRDLRANRGGIARGIERRGVVRMHAGGEVDEPGVRGGDALARARRRRATRRCTTIAAAPAARARAITRVAVGVERGIGEVRVGVEETHGHRSRRARRGDTRCAALPARRPAPAPPPSAARGAASPTCAVFSRGYFVSIQSRIGDAT